MFIRVLKIRERIYKQEYLAEEASTPPLPFACTPMSKKVYLRFYEELNDYLPAERHKVRFEHAFDGDLSIMDLLRAFNIPPEKVDLVLAGRTSVDFAHLLQDGEWISLYPVFELFDVRSLSRLRSVPLRETRFIAGAGLHGLVRNLRLCGFDVQETGNAEPEELIRLSEAESRILLLRATGLARQGRASRAWCVREAKPRLQLLEVLEALDLLRSALPLSRCSSCNHPFSRPGREHEHPARYAHCPSLPLRCVGCGRQISEGPRLNRLLQWVEHVAGLRPDSL